MGFSISTDLRTKACSLFTVGSVDSDGIRKGSSAISIDSSYSECVACVGSEATGSEAQSPI